MIRSTPPLARAARALGLAAALSFAPAVAQDCQLAIQAGKLALYPGQSTAVDVFARFPVGAHAFASSQFRVLADLPAWLAVSAGVVVGDDVLNISASQLHQPFLGVFADPANPLRIWTGKYEPSNWSPRLVRFETTPLSFSYYPSPLTASAASCAADPARDYLAVNPISIGRTAVAPGEGTSIQRTGLNQFRAQSTKLPILIGLLLPAVQGAVEDPRVVLRSSAALDLVEHTIVPQRAAICHGVTVLAWARVGSSPTTGVRVRSTDVQGTEFHFFLGGARVGIAPGNALDAPFVLAELPTSFGARIQHDLAAARTHIVGTGRFERQQTLSVPGLGAVVCDTVEVHVVQNNLKQIGLGMHVFETGGPGMVNVAFMDGSVR